MTTLTTTAQNFTFTLDDLINANARAVAEAAEKQRLADQAREDERQAQLNAKWVRLQQETYQRFRQDVGDNLLAVLDAACHADVPDDRHARWWVEIVYRDRTILLFPQRDQWKIEDDSNEVYVSNIDLPSALLSLLGSIRDGRIQPAPDAEKSEDLPATEPDLPSAPEPAPPHPDRAFLDALDAWLAHRYGLSAIRYEEDDLLF